MSKKEEILKIIQEKKGKTASSEITKKLGVSRQYVSIVIASLVMEGMVVKFGSTRNAFYVSSEYARKHPEVLPSSFRKKYINKGLEEHAALMEIEEQFPLIAQLPENIRSIFTFAFSEMLNNAIEHSRSNTVSVSVTVKNGVLSFVVEDFGIGVFKNIMQTRRLRSETEAIQDLLKGKTTTMPKSHSGEGIFFTSKSADKFALHSFGYELVVAKENVSIQRPSRSKRGTTVTFEIKTTSKLHLNDVFKKYTNLTETSDYGFDKTEIRVKLFTLGGVHISRSQARRILSGLEKFKIIMLDFDQVPIVGQAFVDEIYRVFQRVHPDIRIQEENMSEGVAFMVRRAKNEARKSI
jgi:anti-sigma regulatory factor (Ser/Thr protein kinase)